MKRKLQKQMDSMMETTMDAITNNTKLAPLLNELFKYAPKDEKLNLSYFTKSPINIYMNY